MLRTSSRDIFFLLPPPLLPPDGVGVGWKTIIFEFFGGKYDDWWIKKGDIWEKGEQIEKKTIRKIRGKKLGKWKIYHLREIIYFWEGGWGIEGWDYISLQIYTPSPQSAIKTSSLQQIPAKSEFSVFQMKMNLVIGRGCKGREYNEISWIFS